MSGISDVEAHESARPSPLRRVRSLLPRQRFGVRAAVPKTPVAPQDAPLVIAAEVWTTVLAQAVDAGPAVVGGMVLQLPGEGGRQLICPLPNVAEDVAAYAPEVRATLAAYDLAGALDALPLFEWRTRPAADAGGDPRTYRLCGTLVSLTGAGDPAEVQVWDAGGHPRAWSVGPAAA